jgi:hypothetical protein
MLSIKTLIESFPFQHETLSYFAQIGENFEKVDTFQFFTDLSEAYCNKYVFMAIHKKLFHGRESFFFQLLKNYAAIYVSRKC